jgi:hypothetical protein
MVARGACPCGARRGTGWSNANTSSEVAAAALCTDLNHVLCARAWSQDEDTELCCSNGNNYDDDCEGDDTMSSDVCRGYGDDDTVVVLLLCRHLLASTSCTVAALACSTCRLPKAGSVAVNLV